MTSNTKLIISIGTCIALLMPFGAQATLINNIAISGTGNYTIYELPVGQTTGILTKQPSTPAAVDDILKNNTRVGNVQLGKPSEPSLEKFLTVTFAGGTQAIFSNLLKTDWTDNGDALIKSYITAAAQSVGKTLNSTQMGDAVTKFLTVWQLASDPSIAKIDLVNGRIVVGQDGLLNPADYLTNLLGVTAPPNSQASEAVKVTYAGSTQYLYSFSASRTGYSTADTVSYTGRYIAQTPEPTTLLLLSVGFMGLGYMRRHNKRN